MSDAAPVMVRRFVQSVDAPDEYTYDILWTDRSTGRVVMRYDGADPANTNPAYGAKSDDEYLAIRGYDINDEIDISVSVLPVPPGEAERWAAQKRRREEREQEERDALELLDVLPGINTDHASGYCSSDRDRGDGKTYRDWEEEIATPALKRIGYRLVKFYMVEQDSFGPLTRGVVVECVGCNKRVRFFYG